MNAEERNSTELPPKQSGLRAWQVALLSALVAIVATWPVVKNGLAGRGEPLLVSPQSTVSQVFNNVSNFGQLWTENYWGSSEQDQLRRTYRPLTGTLFALQALVTGQPTPVQDAATGRPTGAYEKVLPFQVINLLLYAGMVAAAAALIGLWTRNPWIGLAVGIAFAVHPIHTEAVGDLAYRGLLLGGLLGFLGLYQHALSNNAATLAFGGVLVGLAALAHEFAAGFVLVALVVDFLLREEQRGPLRRLPFYLTSLIGVGLSFFLAQSMTGGLGPESSWSMGLANPALAPDVPTTDRLMAAIGNYGRLWRLSLAPIPLSIDYSAGAIDMKSGLDLAIGAAALIVPILLGLMLRKKSPWLLAGALIANLLFLLPSNLLLPTEALFADRYLLWPSLGVCLALFALLDRLVPMRMAVAGLAVIVAIPAVPMDWKRLEVWTDYERYNDTLVADSQDADGRIHGVLGQMVRAQKLVGLGLVDEVEKQLRDALDTYPRGWEANKGVSDILKQRAIDAEEGKEALFLEAGDFLVKAAQAVLDDFGGETPTFASLAFEVRELWGTHLRDWNTATMRLNQLQNDAELTGERSSWIALYLAEGSWQLGQHDQAETLFNLAERGAAKNHKHYLLGRYLFNEGEFDRAVAEMDKVSPDDQQKYADAQFTAAEYQLQAQNYEDAVRRYRRIADDDKQAILRRDEARYMLSEALVFHGDQVANEGDTERATRLRQEARLAAEEAIRQRPQHAAAKIGYTVLANLAMLNGDFDESYRNFQRVLQAEPGNPEAVRGMFKASLASNKYGQAIDAAATGASIDTEGLEFPRLALQAATAEQPEPNAKAARQWMDELDRRATALEHQLGWRSQLYRALVFKLEALGLENGDLDDLLDEAEPTESGRVAAGAVRFAEAETILIALTENSDAAEEPQVWRQLGLVRGGLGRAKEGLQDLLKARELVRKQPKGTFESLRRSLFVEIREFERF